MKLKNLSNKIIGIGKVTVLPTEEVEIPVEYEANPTVQFYAECGMAIITGEPSVAPKTLEQIAEEKAEAEQKAKEQAEELRKARLASLNGISEEDLGALAKELGINMATCKDQADVLKKVKTALKK